VSPSVAELHHSQLAVLARTSPNSEAISQYCCEI
jgi:hypothetical protein